MKWIDTHAHITGFSPDGTPRPDLAQQLVAVQRASGADTYFVASLDLGTEMEAVMARPEGVAEACRFLHRITQESGGRVLGACECNPHLLDGSLAAMDLAFGELGFVLFGEMIQYIMHYRMNSEPVVRLVKKAVEYDVPVQVHISTSNSAQGNFSSGIEELDDFLDLVERVPEATYLLAHFVGAPKSDPPVVETYLDIIDRRCGGWPENFWAEIMHFNSPGLPVALQRIPNDRLMPGTDYTTRNAPPYVPYGIIFGKSIEENPYPPNVASLVGFLKEAGANDATIKAIGWDNAARLLKLDGVARP
jgi:predicted TIM-barrel fold metal-dependent hydrolase